MTGRLGWGVLEMVEAVPRWGEGPSAGRVEASAGCCGGWRRDERGGSGSEMEIAEALKTLLQGGGPRPGPVEVHRAAPAAGGDLPGGVPQRPAELFRSGFGHRPGQAQTLRPGGEVAGDQYRDQPGGVGREVVAGEMVEAEGFGGFDAVLDPGVATVAGFKVDDVGVGAVGDEHLVAPALGFEDAALGAGVGFFAPADGPGAGRPGG